MNSNARLRSRLRAAGGMAAVAGLFATALVLYLSYDHRLHIEAVGVIAAATIAAGISGYWIGWRLVDPEEEQDWTSAMALGMAMGLLAYPLCVLLYMVGSIIVYSITSHTLVLDSGFAFLFVFLLFGFASSSIWIALPLAGIVGILLNKCYRKQRRAGSVQTF